MTQPLVTVICLNYNQSRFLREAIDSVLQQTYPAVQIIIVDDGSADDSRSVIEKIVSENPKIRFLDLKQNLGNCRAFNRALSMADGKFIIDFACDDVMESDRIARQVEHLLSLDASYGVLFTDASYIDAGGKYLRSHFSFLFSRGLIDKIPQGDVYRDILERYFIPSPTMIVRKEVFDYLNGYDEDLAYEDFDFWVRSARVFKYAFMDANTTRIRMTHNSMSAKAYAKGDKQLHSTYLVCRKAFVLNRTREENIALARRIRFEIRQSVFTANYAEAQLFFQLLKEVDVADAGSKFFMLLGKMRIPLTALRRVYLKIRYR